MSFALKLAGARPKKERHTTPVSDEDSKLAICDAGKRFSSLGHLVRELPQTGFTGMKAETI